MKPLVSPGIFCIFWGSTAVAPVEIRQWMVPQCIDKASQSPMFSTNWSLCHGMRRTSGVNAPQDCQGDPSAEDGPCLKAAAPVAAGRGPGAIMVRVLPTRAPDSIGLLLEDVGALFFSFHEQNSAVRSLPAGPGPTDGILQQELGQGTEDQHGVLRPPRLRFDRHTGRRQRRRVPAVGPRPRAQHVLLTAPACG